MQYPHKFQRLIEERGVKILGSINPIGAGTDRAAAAYNSIEQGKEGKKFYHCPEKFNKFVLGRVLKKKLSSSESEAIEFDVVKKRRMMDQAPEEVASECPDSLQRFEAFEAHVLPALLKIDAEDKQTRNDELIQMELDICSGAALPCAGGVYVAVSKAVKFPKIGATRKSEPAPRLKALSRYVPSPFEAVYWVPTIMPFKVESEIHRHFDAFRLREAGACTEFFNVDVQAIGEYLKANYAVLEAGAL